MLKMPCEIIVTAVKEWCEPADPPKCQEHDEPVVRLQDVAVSQMLKTQMRKKKTCSGRVREFQLHEMPARYH